MDESPEAEKPQKSFPATRISYELHRCRTNGANPQTGFMYCAQEGRPLQGALTEQEAIAAGRSLGWKPGEVCPRCKKGSFLVKCTTTRELVICASAPA
jgi:hypothetical protein